MLHYRDTYAQIDMDSLLDNVDLLYKKVNKPLMAILKANAYGHGYQEVASVLKDLPMVQMFGVATLKEAIDLRNIGIQQDILVLGAIPLEDLSYVIEYDITLTLFSLSYIQEIIAKYQGHQPIKGHIKIDTGMNRLGLKTKEELQQAMNLCHQDIFHITGVFTHYAVADDSQQQKAYLQQVKQFQNMIKDYSFEWVHSQNSASMMYHETLPDNMARMGIALYGCEPSGEESHELKQVMSLYTTVAMIKKVHAGEHIGYGYTYQALQEEYIATLPIGYADGLIRANQGRCVVIHGKEYPIVGRICMDQMMIKVDETIHEHDVVEIFGPHISLSRMAKELHTIPYEILCLVSERVERVYIQNKKK